METRSLGALQGVRPPAVAGAFYPHAPGPLRQAVMDYLKAAEGGSWPETATKALIAPHAGYVYSGPVAGSAFARVRQGREIRRVVLLGPSHRVAFHGLALSSAAQFASPLGQVAVDADAVRRLEGLPQVRVLDAAHAGEHALEVELPFLQVLFPAFSLVPLVVGDATDEAVGEVLELLWGGMETLVVVSSDLSHFHEYAVARRLDAQTALAIEQGRREDIGEDQACGRIPIRGLLWAARKHGLAARTLDLRNSGDTAGPRDRVVGYGAFAFGRG
ncbi:MAG: AmmeMemoRadiSam system protein B [Verrucomicrobia bacterium]|nr:AmmeMemoRadiSam system protein B [Verrucomicrobiota bacterium]